MFNANQQSVRSIIRRASHPDKLNIITFATHERYEENLCKTGHDFHSIKKGKLWNTNYAPIPHNYFPIDELYIHTDYDLILCHTTDERLEYALQMGSFLNIPIVRLCHVLPDIRHSPQHQIYGFNSVNERVTNTFISEFNRSVWQSRGEIIEHGIDTDFYKPDPNKPRNAHALSVVNFWSQRDWCCGWNLFNYVKEGLPTKVLGDDPPHSFPASSLEELRDTYQTSLVFLNTSLHSPVPTVLLEAMSCGCAIVSTETCMIPDIITNGVNGYLTNDPDELKARVRELLDNPDRALEMGLAARRTIEERFNLSRFTTDWNNLFKKVIENYETLHI